MIRLLLASLVVFALACTKKDDAPIITPTPTFTVENNHETMPVWVHGKSDAGCILIAVHGGPGSDVLDFRTYQSGTGFKKIEEDYLVAYWQQRSAGQSYGSDDTTHFTIAQYVQDLDKVVDEIKARYPNKKIALLGHSWGGMLTSSYLKEDTRRAKINGWIDAAGATDGTSFIQTTVSDLNEEADYRISINENVAYWQDIKAQILADSSNANRLAYKVVEKISQVPIKVNASGEEFILTLRAINSNLTLFDQILVTDNSATLANFNKPVLILWGKYDFAVSKQIRDKAIQNLTNAQITNILFSASGHYMMFHEPDLFASSVKTFLGSL